MTGRVIIVPMANAPAAQAGRRNSPIDGLNLNRIYPGDIRGMPTAMIASYLERHLMSEADIVLDLHSGGRSLRYLPCATFIDHSDATERARRLSLALAFGGPAILMSHAYEERAPRPAPPEERARFESAPRSAVAPAWTGRWSSSRSVEP